MEGGVAILALHKSFGRKGSCIKIEPPYMFFKIISALECNTEVMSLKFLFLSKE